MNQVTIDQGDTDSTRSTNTGLAHVQVPAKPHIQTETHTLQAQTYTNTPMESCGHRQTLTLTQRRRHRHK